MLIVRLFSLLLLSLCLSCEKDVVPEKVYMRPSEDVSGKIAFVNVDVVTMSNDDLMTNTTVFVEDGIIQYVGPPDDFELPEGTFIIDNPDLYLMPGLADCHTHIYYEEDLLPYLANGVTTVLNMGSPPSILTFRDKVRSGELIGPSIYASAFVDGAGQNGWIVTSPEEAATDVEEIASMGWDFIKVYNSIKSDVFVALVEEGAKHDIKVIGHGVREPGFEFIINNGQVMIAHAEEFIYTFFNNSLDESRIAEVVALTKSSGVYVTPNLSAFEAIAAQSGNVDEFNRRMTQPSIAYVSENWINRWTNGNPYINNNIDLHPHYDFLKKLTKALSDGDVPLLLGTDSPFVPTLAPGFSIHDDLRTLVDAGLTPYQALKSGTTTVDNFFKAYAENYSPSGKIEVGYRADMILLTGNPLESVENVALLQGVMANGRWLSTKKLDELLEEIR